MAGRGGSMTDDIDDQAVVTPANSHVLHRYTEPTYPVMVHGQGRTLRDASGREYLDAAGGGAAVTVIGYGNQHVIDAAARQMGELPFIHNVRFTNRQQEALAERLASHTPAGINRTCFVQGG